MLRLRSLPAYQLPLFKATCILHPPLAVLPWSHSGGVQCYTAEDHFPSELVLQIAAL